MYAIRSYYVPRIHEHPPPPGPITFYACGLEGNGGGTSGDYVYTAKTTVYQAEISTPSAVWPLNTTQPLSLAAPGHVITSYSIHYTKLYDL